MRVEFIKQTKFGREKAGTIHLNPYTKKLSASATPGHGLGMQRIISTPVYVGDKFIDPKKNPVEWFDGLTTNYAGSYLYARRVQDQFTEQEHWITLPGGKHVLIGGRTPAVKQALPQLPKVSDIDRSSFKNLYKSDAEFRDFADAVHAYTDGQNKVITAAAERYVQEGEKGLEKLTAEPPFEDKDFDVFGEKPLAAQEKLQGVKREDIMRYGIILNHAIASAPEEDKTVWRGASAPQPIADFENLKPGSEFQLAGPRSFSHTPKIALTYINPTHSNKYMFVLDGKSKGINAKAISATPELDEFITSGRFKVKSIDKDFHVTAGGIAQEHLKVFHLQQTGVFDVH